MSRRLYCLTISAFSAFVVFNAAPALAQSCGDDLQKLSEKRAAALQSINAMVAAAKGKQLDPTVFCTKSQPLNVVENEMLAYMNKNKDWCQIPDDVIDQLKATHAKSLGLFQQGLHSRRANEKNERTGRSGRRPAGSAAARRPALSGKTPSAALPDARPASLVLKIAPEWALPFVQLARWDRPIGWQLLLAPCWESAALAGLAAHRGPNLWHLVLFFVGAVAMRGAGCTYNDILDRKLDAGVERTRGRPLPSGRAAVSGAATFLVLQSLVGLAVLLCFNRFSIALGFASLVVVGVYPLMKRITSWPQAVLGLAFSWGALMGWAGAFGSLAWPALALYASAFCWTVGYDTIYAQQDARDDAIVGIRSTARLFGAHARLGVAIFYVLTAAFAQAALVGAGAGLIAEFGWLGFCLHLAWQVSEIDGASPATALRLFRSNRDAGLILFAGLALNGWAAG